MLIDNITGISSKQFSELINEKRVIILYPRSNYRNLFLAHFLANPTYTILYYRITGEGITLVEFVQQLVDSLGDAVDGFGANLITTLADGKPDELAHALKSDLDAVAKDRQIVLYLDEFDRIKFNRQARAFVKALLDVLDARHQLAVSARVLTYRPWNEAVERGDAVVLGTSFRRNQLIYTVDSKHRPQLEVYAFGPGHALVNGVRVETWDGALPRNLFFFLIDNDLVTRDQIFEIFWPSLNTKEATNVFHVTKRKITERISDAVFGGGNYELTNYANGFYSPSNKIVRHYDVADFVALIDEATMTFNDDEQASLYRQAVEIYRGPFLTTLDMPWALDRRTKLQRMFVEALIGLARYHKAGKRYAESLGYFIRTLREEPQREDIFREVMMLYDLMGYREEALKQYQHLEELLRDTLEVEPSRETRDLYQKLLS